MAKLGVSGRIKLINDMFEKSVLGTITSTEPTKKVKSVFTGLVNKLNAEGFIENESVKIEVEKYLGKIINPEKIQNFLNNDKNKMLLDLVKGIVPEIKKIFGGAKIV